MTESRSMSCPSAAIFADLVGDLYAREMERKRRFGDSIELRRAKRKADALSGNGRK